MAEDPRADILREDPFTRPKPTKIHHIHSREESMPHVLRSMFNVQMRREVEIHTGNIWHFSEEEKAHLLLATAAFTLALGLMRVGGILQIGSYGTSSWLLTLLLSMPVMLIAVGPAFILHEIGHKIAARRYGCWAEFRADPKGLQTGVLISMILGIVFMAPGAVMVAGMVSKKQNGHIAAAGPLVNLSLFIIGVPLGGILLGVTGATDFSTHAYLEDGKLIWQAMVYDAVMFWITANLILGLFNMLPFGPLDGLKVKAWNNGAFYLLISVFAVPIICWLSGIWSPMETTVSIANLF